jgi:hypothetical protein
MTGLVNNREIFVYSMFFRYCVYFILIIIFFSIFELYLYDLNLFYLFGLLFVFIIIPLFFERFSDDYGIKFFKIFRGVAFVEKESGFYIKEVRSFPYCFTDPLGRKTTTYDIDSSDSYKRV